MIKKKLFETYIIPKLAQVLIIPAHHTDTENSKLIVFTTGNITSFSLINLFKNMLEFICSWKQNRIHYDIYKTTRQLSLGN